MQKLIVVLIMFIASITAAEARHQHSQQTAVWDWNSPGFWRPFPGTVIEHRSGHPRRPFAGPGMVQHERVRNARLPDAPRIETRHTPVSEAITPGIVRSTSGAVAHVARQATAAFQCVVTELESVGYRITEMGGFARSGHIRHSLHYSGLALDINQVRRNVTIPPMPANEIEIARGCGLISGAQWNNADSGHFQLGGWAGRKDNVRFASRYRHRVRYTLRSRHVRSLYASARPR